MTITNRPPPKGQGLGPVTRTKPTHYPCVVLWVFQPPDGPKTVGFNEPRNEAAFVSLIEAMDYEVRQTGGELLTFKVVHPAPISQTASAVRFCKVDGERGSDELFCGTCGGKTTLVGFKDNAKK
ncbi:MAG: hypothetical protein ACYC44_00470 [Patescibacteria group bacterium]